MSDRVPLPQGSELRAGPLSRPSTGVFSALYSSCYAVLCADPVLLFYDDAKRQKLKDTCALGRHAVCTVSGRTVLVQEAERSLKLRGANASDAAEWQAAIQSAVEAAFAPALAPSARTARAEPAPAAAGPSDDERPRLTSYQRSGTLVGGVELDGGVDLASIALSVAPAAANDSPGELASMSDASDGGSGDEAASAPQRPVQRALSAARAAAEACSDEGGEMWSAAAWSRSLELERILAASLCTKWLDEHAPDLLPAQRSAAELAFVRSLGQQLAQGECSAQQLATLLGRTTLLTVAETYGSAATQLVDTPVTLDELSSKFLQEDGLFFGDLDAFNAGLDATIGPPHPELLVVIPHGSVDAWPLCPPRLQLHTLTPTPILPCPTATLRPWSASTPRLSTRQCGSARATTAWRQSPASSGGLWWTPQ